MGTMLCAISVYLLRIRYYRKTLMGCKLFYCSQVFLFWGICIFGCGVMGPPFPEKNAEAYLNEIGVPFSTISALIKREKLTEDDIRFLSSQPNDSVRYLVAANPSLSKSQRIQFLNDPNTFVKTGVAENPNLSREEIEYIISSAKIVKRPFSNKSSKKSDPSFYNLASNQNVPTDLLLTLFYIQETPSFSAFASNRNCPNEIKEIIRKSNDEFAKKLLKNQESNKNLGITEN